MVLASCHARCHDDVCWGHNTAGHGQNQDLAGPLEAEL